MEISEFETKVSLRKQRNESRLSTREDKRVVTNDKCFKRGKSFNLKLLNDFVQAFRLLFILKVAEASR